MHRFQNRSEAGWQLAQIVAFLKGKKDFLVLGIAKGGVPIAYEIALAIRAPMDVMLVSKLKPTDEAELTFGAVASDGSRAFNTTLVQDLGLAAAEIEAVVTTELDELHRRERAYRQGKAPLSCAGKTVLLVDDGIATGLTMQAAIKALKAAGTAKILLAVPVIPATTHEELRPEVDDLFCLETPEPFREISNWYYDFTPPSDADVKRMLAVAATINPLPGVATFPVQQASH